MIEALKRLGQLYEGEGWKVLWFSLLGSVLQAGIGIGYVGSDSLFITYLGVEKLPYIYFILPFCMLVITPVLSLLTQRLGAWMIQFITGLTLCAGGIGMFALTQTAVTASPGYETLFFAVKLYSAVCYISVYTVYWNFVDNYFDILSAKRLFPLMAGANTIGSMLGGFWVTRSIDLQIPVSYLFLIWSGLAVLALFPVMRLRRFSVLVRFEDSKDQSFNEQVSTLYTGFTKSRYALLLAVSSFLVMTLAPLCEYQYMQIFEEVYEDEQQLANILGTLFMAANGFNTFIVLFLFNRMVANFGVRNIALIQPVTYLAAFTGYIAVFGSENAMFWLAVFGFFAFQGIHSSIEYNNFNFIINPIPRDIKASIRTLIEGWTEPFGGAFAGLLLLALSTYFGFSHLGISFVAVWIGILYLISILWLRSLYAPAMIDNLRSEWLDFSRDESQVYGSLSTDEILSLREILRSGNSEHAIFACRCLWHNDRIQALTSLFDLWGQASRSEKQTYCALLDEMLNEEDTDVYRLFLDWLTFLDEDSKKILVQRLSRHNLISVNMLVEMLQSKKAETRASVLGLLWRHWDVQYVFAAVKTFHELINGSRDERRTAIYSFENIRESRFAEYIKVYLDDPDPDISRAARVTLTRIADRQNRNLVNEVLSLLNDDDPDVRTAVFHAVERIGDSGSIPILLTHARWFSPYQRRQAQHAIFSIGLKSVPACISVLRDESYSHRARSIAARALAQMAFPQMESLLPRLIDREIHQAYKMMYHFYVMSRHLSESKRIHTNGLECLKRFYQEEQFHSLHFMLELLSLGGRIANHEMLAASLQSTSRVTRGNAIESLEQSVSRSVYQRLLPLVDGRSIERQVAFYRQRFRPQPLTFHQIVESAWQSDDSLEKAIAAQAKLELAKKEKNHHPEWGAFVRSSVEAICLDLDHAHPFIRQTVLSLIRKLEQNGSDTVIDRLVSMKQTHLFASVMMTELTGLAEHIEPVQYRAGQAVYQKDDPADAVFILHQNDSPPNTPPHPAFAHNGVLGIDVLLDQPRYTHDAVMKQDVRLYRISKERLLECARLHTHLAMQWINEATANRR